MISQTVDPRNIFLSLKIYPLFGIRFSSKSISDLLDSCLWKGSSKLHRPILVSKTCDGWLRINELVKPILMTHYCFKFALLLRYKDFKRYDFTECYNVFKSSSSVSLQQWVDVANWIRNGLYDKRVRGCSNSIRWSFADDNLRGD